MIYPFVQEKNKVSRSQSLKLAVASVLPLLLLAFAGSVELVKRERAAFERGLQGQIRALASAVDGQAEVAVAALGALAASGAVASGDAGAFREQAQRVLAQHAGWGAIELLSPSGERLAAAVRDGAEPPPFNERALAQRVARSLREAVGAYEPMAGGIPIAVPVRGEGEARYVVAALVTPAVLDSLLRRQGFPAGWDITVHDREARPIARLAGAVPLQGADAYSVRRDASYTGWSVVAAVPAATVDAGATGIAWLFVGGGAALALAMALLWALTRPAPPAPLLHSAANDAAAPAVSRAVVRPASAERRRRNVLIAASDADLRRALVLAFASDENRVYAVCDGAEALALAHDVRPSLVLADIRLARISGYDVAKQLRHQYGRTVSLVGIGGRDPGDRARALAAGFDEHLASPVTQDGLAQALNRLRGSNRVASRSSS
jgi:CheY-like chemotaxis protein